MSPIDRQEHDEQDEQKLASDGDENN